MRIAIGSDFAAFELKEFLREALVERASFHDLGVYEVTSQTDYPDIAEVVAQKVIEGEADRGILVCGTGIGMSIAANKVPGVRAVVTHDVFSAIASVEHNNANVLCMGARVIGKENAALIAREWLDASYTTGLRHAVRLDKIAQIERKHSEIGEN